MLNAEILKQFCYKFGFNGLNEPFNIGNYTYATDGALLIRIPKLEEITNELTNPSQLKILTAINFLENLTFNIEISQLITIEQTCSACNGLGYYKNCPDCDASGNIEFESDSGIIYNVDCTMCDSTGYIDCEEEDAQICENCNGKKVRMIIEDIPYDNILLNGKYLQILKTSTLENVKFLSENDYKTVCIDNMCPPVPFKFDGGFGILMPKRKMQEN
jgi:hypothetical protein